jgi:hypothetical protein
VTRELIGTGFWGAVFLVNNAALAYAAHLVGRRFFADDPVAVRWAAVAIAFVGLVLTLTQILAAVALYDRLVVTVSSLLLAGVVHYLWNRHRNIEAETAHLRAWFHAVSESRGAVLLCAALLAVGLAAVRGLVSPPMNWDSLMYHLFFAGRLVQLHTLASFVGLAAMDYYAHYPINGEIMAAWLMLPFRSDLLVGVLNFPFLALGAVAIYGLCREIGVARGEASLAACLVCFSPVLFFYVTTQDVDIQVFAALMCSTLFVLRYLLHAQDRDAIVALVATGIAVGTKHTALALAAMLLAILGGALVLYHIRRRAWGGLVSVVGCGLILAMIVGGRQYVTNWYETGNPIYPVALTVAGRQILPGSGYTQMIAANFGPGNRRDDLIQFVNAFNYLPKWKLPRSAGPAFPLLIVFAFGSVVYSRRYPQGWAVRLLAALGALEILAFYVPGTGFPALARRIFPVQSDRFLAPALALLVVAAMPAVGRLRRRYPQVLGILACFVLWDILVTNTTISASFALAAGLGLAVLLPAGLVLGSNGWLPRLTPQRMGIGIVAAGLIVPSLLQHVRDGNRWQRYATPVNYAWFPRGFVDGWHYCDRPGRSLRIALTAGWGDQLQHLLFYPLMGSRLQNTVIHVAPDPAHLFRRDTPGDAPDGHLAERWVQRLHEENVDLIFIEAPWPIEDKWMRAAPDKFRVARASEAFRIYELLDGRPSVE